MFLSQIRIDSDRFPARDDYPFCLPVLREAKEISFSKPVTFFVGENGSGKSTLLEAIARKCHIHIWSRAKRRDLHLGNGREVELWKYLAIQWVDGPVSGSLFSAETFIEVADTLDDIGTNDPGQLKYFGGKILNELSHGQGTMSYFEGRYRYRGLYFMDEPEAALSPVNQVRLVKLLHRIQGEGHAQFIIATHSPILLALPGAQILCFDSGRIQETYYQETRHFRLYKQFLNDPYAFLYGPSCSL